MSSWGRSLVAHKNESTSGTGVVFQMCWRSGAKTVGDARHMLVTCIAIGCYRVTNIWLALNLTRPAWNTTNLWHAQEIKNTLYIIYNFSQKLFFFTHPENGCVKSLRNVSNSLPTKSKVQYDVRHLTEAPNTFVAVTSKCPKVKIRVTKV